MCFNVHKSYQSAINSPINKQTIITIRSIYPTSVGGNFLSHTVKYKTISVFAECVFIFAEHIVCLASNITELV